MTVIDVSTLTTVLGAPGTAVTDGTVQCTPWAGLFPAARIDGSDIVVPDHVQVAIIAGIPATPLDLPRTDGTYCWRITVTTTSPQFTLTRFVAVPASGPVEFADLVDVDRTTFTPDAAAEPAWWAAFTALQAQVNAIDAVASPILVLANAAPIPTSPPPPANTVIVRKGA